MPSLPLSPRLLLLPFAALPSLRLGALQLGRVVLEADVDAKTALPSVECLRAVATSPVAGLHLRVSAVHAGWATLQDVHAALLEIRASGKQVVVELDATGNAEMMLASAASRAVVRPASHVNLLGVGAAMRFGGEALERLGLRFDVEAAGAYKSLGEAFTRRWASPENREAMRAIVDDLQAQLEEAVARGRGCSAEDVRARMADGPLPAEEARARGLVDALAYPDEVMAWWEGVLDRKPRTVELARWWKRRQARDRALTRVRGGERVVVLHLAGNVVDGEGTPGQRAIAATTVVEAVDAVREDKGAKAVVLHVNSPGGSAAASDLIWRAVQRLAETRTVVAVFGDVAASGGYYLAAPAKRIFAREGTLTGSIGVVGGKLVFGGAGEKLGVHTELLLGAPMAALFSANRPFTDEERARFKAALADTYAAFLDRVGRGRGKPVTEVEPLARGRVWTGERAREVGLVDAFGGVHEGVVSAAELAGLSRWRRQDVVVGAKLGFVQKLIRRAMGQPAEETAGTLAWVLARLGVGASLRALAAGQGRPMALALDLEPLLGDDA